MKTFINITVKFLIVAIISFLSFLGGVIFVGNRTMRYNMCKEKMKLKDIENIMWSPTKIINGDSIILIKYYTHPINEYKLQFLKKDSTLINKHAEN